ncbi:DNA-binding domain-containing protein [Psychromonas sp. KJ10-10]|uniref:HvfC/BufC N-terminal domain-containing protein n=1 Tax=Psychromonas sp. KJ10-10 TaxID=3391823 RepID=UPI0039B3972A
MSTQDYIDAFAEYLRSGDSNGIDAFCENSSHINRLAVYRNGFYKGCIDALSANFPMCEKKLSTDRFRDVARLYVDHFPPEQGTLVGYGINFPQFLEKLLSDTKLNRKGSDALAESRHVESDENTNLVNMAQLDYAWLMSLMSADSKDTLTIDYVNALLQEGIELTELNVRLNPSVRLVKVDESAFYEWVSLKTNNDQQAST